MSVHSVRVSIRIHALDKIIICFYYTRFFCKKKLNASMLFLKFFFFRLTNWENFIAKKYIEILMKLSVAFIWSRSGHLFSLKRFNNALFFDRNSEKKKNAKPSLWKKKKNVDLTSALHLISCIPRDHKKLENLLDNPFLLLLQINRINDHKFIIIWNFRFHPIHLAIHSFIHSIVH